MKTRCESNFELERKQVLNFRNVGQAFAHNIGHLANIILKVGTVIEGRVKHNKQLLKGGPLAKGLSKILQVSVK